jgi:hypothetical protein
LSLVKAVANIFAWYHEKTNVKNGDQNRMTELPEGDGEDIPPRVLQLRLLWQALR